MLETTVQTGLDRLLEDLTPLKGRRWGLLSHHAAVTSDFRPGHVALQQAGEAPVVLLAPEHGYYGVEQDMVPAEGGEDPMTGIPIRSLYGESSDSLVPDPSIFRDLDLFVIDLQDVGTRYYTYAATAVWSAEVAADAGCKVMVLDRPNPLGGDGVEGSLRGKDLESFVSAFSMPVRHGLTLAELVNLEALRRGFHHAVESMRMEGWRRWMSWPQTERPWIAPSPNMPSFETAVVYPGACLLEATELSEGRGTTRPFLWSGAPGVDAGALVEHLNGRNLPGVRFLPIQFRPQFQKHAGEVCSGVETVVTDPEDFEALRTGVELLAAYRITAPEAFAWREAPYEFVDDTPAIDLLTGSSAVREALDADDEDPLPALEHFASSWESDEIAFREERRIVLLYPEH